MRLDAAAICAFSPFLRRAVRLISMAPRLPLRHALCRAHTLPLMLRHADIRYFADDDSCFSLCARRLPLLRYLRRRARAALLRLSLPLSCRLLRYATLRRLLPLPLC